MAMIDCSFIDGFISDFNDFFTRLARLEQSKESEDTQEDISSTVVKVTREDNQIALSISTNKNNSSSVWVHNFYTMARSLFPDRMREYLTANPEAIAEQVVSPLVANLVGGFSQ